MGIRPIGCNTRLSHRGSERGALAVGRHGLLRKRRAGQSRWGGYDYGGGTPEPVIGRARLDGTKVDRTFIPDPTSFGGPSSGIREIAVDGDHIYWTDVFGHAGAGSSGSIGRANIDGTGAEPGFIGFGEAAIPTGLAVDASHISVDVAPIHRDGSRGVDGADESDESLVDARAVEVGAPDRGGAVAIKPVTGWGLANCPVDERLCAGDESEGRDEQRGE